MATTVQTGGVSNELLAAMNSSRNASTGASGIEDIQNRFMTLLVAQMQHQDPLNPMDNAQVTSQMAQLSTVTGINQLNATLEALQSSYQATQSLQAVNMIGHGVLVPGSTIDLSEGKSVFGIELAEPADSVEVRIIDAAGNVVRKVDLGPQEAGAVPVAWDGAMDNGETAGDGRYRFEVVARRGDLRVEAGGLAFGVVGSVSTGNEGVKLNVPGIGVYGLNDVRQVL